MFDLTGKTACKAWLQKRSGLAAEPDTPLVAFVGRLVDQKGVAQLLESIDELAGMRLQLVIVGRGPLYERAFERVSRAQIAAPDASRVQLESDHRSADPLKTEHAASSPEDVLPGVDQRPVEAVAHGQPQRSVLEGDAVPMIELGRVVAPHVLAQPLETRAHAARPDRADSDLMEAALHGNDSPPACDHSSLRVPGTPSRSKSKRPSSRPVGSGLRPAGQGRAEISP